MKLLESVVSNPFPPQHRERPAARPSRFAAAGALEQLSDPNVAPPVDRTMPRLWGLTIARLHDRFWQSRGVQVVRCQAGVVVNLDADLYLLAEPDALVIFDQATVANRLYWGHASLLRLRLHDRRPRGYDERIVLDADGRFVEVRRSYDRLEARLIRFGVTSDAKVAQGWIEQADARYPWRALVAATPRRLRAVASVSGRCFFDDDAQDRGEFVRHLTQIWRSPDATIGGLRPIGAHVWAPRESGAALPNRVIGPVWLGKGHADGTSPLLVGPGVVWDAPAAAGVEPCAAVDWATVRPSVKASRVVVRPAARRRQIAKRLFDIAFASFGLIVTAPLFPLVMAAIWLEDGRPFFFGHRRESRGGTEFPCWKFRSMYRDAERRRQELIARNQVDGPQFYIADDPRVTKVGRFLRRFNIDELPQFWNVLKGDMSVVGPRPSPRAENQYYPPWRDARLSVKPGITGLWQVCRSRQRGSDFQEWIKYDLEYVRKNSMLFDLVIIWRSIAICIRGERRPS